MCVRQFSSSSRTPSAKIFADFRASTCFNKGVELYEISPQYFKRDKNGSTVWFPHSFWGRGYVLTEEREQELREGMKGSAYRVPLAIAATFFPLMAWLFKMPVILFFALILIPMLIGMFRWRARAKRLTQGLATSPVKITFIEFVHHELIRQYEYSFAFCVIGIFVALIFASLFLYNFLTKGL